MLLQWKPVESFSCISNECLPEAVGGAYGKPSNQIVWITCLHLDFFATCLTTATGEF